MIIAKIGDFKLGYNDIMENFTTHDLLVFQKGLAVASFDENGELVLIKNHLFQNMKTVQDLNDLLAIAEIGEKIICNSEKIEAI